MEVMDKLVVEVSRIRESLPPRPSAEEVEAATLMVRNAEHEEKSFVDAITEHSKGTEAPEDLFNTLEEMQRNLALFQIKEKKSKAKNVLDLESSYTMLDEMIEKASFFPCSSSSTRAVASPNASSSCKATLEDRDLNAFKLGNSGSLPPRTSPSPDAAKSSFAELPSLTRLSSEEGIRELELNLQGKLVDEVEWSPDLMEKLSAFISLDLSQNRLVALLATIGGLSSLTTLILRGNHITELPDTIGDMSSLEHLDLSSNMLTLLPSAIGKLTRLVRLDLSLNNLEELPYNIKNFTSLVELRAGHNQITFLPGGIGSLKYLEILSLRNNRIKELPGTMGGLSSLREIDIRVNELENVSQSLCQAGKLVVMNISRNFSMTSLPDSIGDLVMLEELDITENEIKILPDSFHRLSRLRVFHAEGNPLKVPPMSIAKEGAQAVLRFMADHVANKEDPRMGSLARLCLFPTSKCSSSD